MESGSWNDHNNNEASCLGTFLVLAASTTDPAVRASHASALDPVIFYGVFVLLLFGPLAFGAVEAWSIFILEAGAALLLLLWTVRQATSGELSVLGNALFAPMLVFAICIGLQLATGRTAYRYETSSAGLLYCAYGILCFLVIQVVRRTAQVQALTLILTVYGFLLASFAILQSLSSTSQLYWLRTPRSGGWIYGPYVNHNHYAGLMEMLVPVPLIFSLTRGARGPRRAMAALAAALMASTIFLSGSRGGMLALAVQITLLAAVMTWQQKGRKAAVALAIFLLVGVGLMAWLGGSELTKRLVSIHSETRTELSGGLRIQMDRDALKMFVRKPLSGWGLGVFPAVYPQFRSFSTNFFINEVHNDYLQLLVEMGGLGFVTMLWFVWALYRNGARKLHNWTEDTNGAVALVAILGVTGILVHSFFDFNLQVPANAALFYVLCVVAAMEPRFGLSRRRRVRPVEIMSEVSGSTAVDETPGFSAAERKSGP
jgi:O-antigen ligase